MNVETFEMKSSFSKFLDEVASGKRITITKYGKPVAMLVPVEAAVEKK